jgi:hypothetical protein
MQNRRSNTEPNRYEHVIIDFTSAFPGVKGGRLPNPESLSPYHWIIKTRTAEFDYHRSAARTMLRIISTYKQRPTEADLIL